MSIPDDANLAEYKNGSECGTPLWGVPPLLKKSQENYSDNMPPDATGPCQIDFSDTFGPMVSVQNFWFF